MTRTHEPIFIVGPGRSGTTLLFNVLRNHPDFYCPATETGYFAYLDVIRRLFDHLDEPRWRATIAGFVRDVLENGFQSDFDRPIPAAEPVGSDVRYRDYGAAFRSVLDTLALAGGKTRWADKSPHHVFATDEIFDAIPDAKIVEMVRDPRGVVASKLTMQDQIWTTDRFRSDERDRKALENAADPFWDGLKWKEAIRAGKAGAARHRERWLRLRYEDLIDEPERIVRELCEFIGAPFSDALLAVPRGITGDTEMGTEPGGIARTSRERWRDSLSDTDVAVVQRVCGAEMRELAYEPVPTRTGAARVWAQVVLRSSVDLASRARRQLKHGGPRMVLDSARNRIRQARFLGRH